MSDDQKSDDVLYAGKYKTVAELEEGYKKSLPVHQENENLKKRLEDASKVPDMYMTPADVILHDADVEEVKRLAKSSGLTQTQFEKLARETNAKSVHKHESFESAKRELGSDKLNILQDYIKKKYPEGKIADAALRTIIMDKDAQISAFADRDAMLKSTIPGSARVSPAGGGYAVTHADALKAREQMHKSSGKEKVAARERYISIQAELAHNKQ